MKTCKRIIAAQAGKLKYEYGLMSDKKNQEGRVIFIFTREQIENHDISTFLGTFSPDQDSSELKNLQGKVIFAVDGYDDTSEPLCLIPEVRVFFAQCDRWWSCWHYFADVQSQSFAMLACCLQRNVVVVQSTRREDLEVTLQLDELTSFFEGGVPSAAYIFNKAGTSKRSGMKLLREVAKYLQIPT